MRKFLHEIFYIPQHNSGKMREKAFMARITVSVATIIICLFTMAISAYAWFSVDITSSFGEIVSAIYDLSWKVTVTDDSGEVQTSSNSNIVIHNDTDAPKTFKIHLEESQKSTASTGFCVIKVDFGNDGVIDKTYHTAQIGEDINAQGGMRNKLDFTITLNQSARITFISHWGTSSRYAEFKTITDSDGKTNYITDGATVVLGTLQYTPEGNNQDQQDTTEQDAEDAVSDETTDDITSDETTQNTTSTETESSESSDTTTSTPNEPSSQTPTPSETITPSDESAKENTEENSSTETSDDKTSSTESDEKTTNDATNSANPDESNESFETEENIVLSDNTEFNS